MQHKIDTLLVVDLEASCWPFGQKPPDEQQEIIEIGICEVDNNSLKRLRKESILVRPTMSKISPYCENLTTLTQTKVDTGIGFADACALLNSKFNSLKRPWMSYGEFDREMFTAQCRTLGVEYPFGNRHTNLKHVLAIALGWPKEHGMKRALAQLGLPLEGTHHRGDDDAWNIANLWCEFVRRLRKP